MNMRINVARNVVIDHSSDRLNIKATRRDIGRDKSGEQTILVVMHSFVALLLHHVPVQTFAYYLCGIGRESEHIKTLKGESLVHTD
jgi:hypothetical protein